MIRLFLLIMHKRYYKMSVYMQTKSFHVYLYLKSIGNINNNKRMGIPPTKCCKIMEPVRKRCFQD